MGEPLNVAWIWNIATNPATEPGGALRRGFVQATGPDGRLTRLADRGHRMLRTCRSLSRPDPETLESWANHAKTDPASAPGLTALRAAAAQQAGADRTLRPDRHPQPRTRPASATRPRSSSRRAPSRSANVLDIRLDPRTTDVSPLDSAALARLELSQVDRVVVAPDALVAPAASPQFTPARPFTLVSGGRQFSTVQTDDGHRAAPRGQRRTRAACSATSSRASRSSRSSSRTRPAASRSRCRTVGIPSPHCSTH